MLPGALALPGSPQRVVSLLLAWRSRQRDETKGSKKTKKKNQKSKKHPAAAAFSLSLSLHGRALSSSFISHRATQESPTDASRSPRTSFFTPSPRALSCECTLRSRSSSVRIDPNIAFPPAAPRRRIAPLSYITFYPYFFTNNLYHEYLPVYTN